MLTAMISCDGRHTGGFVCDANAGFSDVLVLSTRAASTEHIDATFAQEFVVIFGNRNSGLGGGLRHERQSA